MLRHGSLSSARRTVWRNYLAFAAVMAFQQHVRFGVERTGDIMTQSASMGGDISADNLAGGSGETLAPKPYVLGDAVGPLNRDELVAIDAWWRAANYLAVGQIYLLDNPLLREPLQSAHIKPRLLGHFGNGPRFEPGVGACEQADPAKGSECGVRGRSRSRRAGAERVCVVGGQLLRALQSHRARHCRNGGLLPPVFVPGWGAQPLRTRDAWVVSRGRRSWVFAPMCSGLAFDNPDLTVFCVVGDGEAETGPLATSWHELPPPRITDDPCEATVGDHTHDVEVLDVENLVLARRSALPSGRYIVCVAFCTCSERSMPEYVWTKGILGASSAPNRAWPMS